MACRPVGLRGCGSACQLLGVVETFMFNMPVDERRASMALASAASAASAPAAMQDMQDSGHVLAESSGWRLWALVHGQVPPSLDRPALLLSLLPCLLCLLCIAAFYVY